MLPLATHTPPDRSEPIRCARERVLHAQLPAASGLVAPWIERSWRRCIAAGHRTETPLDFDPVPAARARETAEANRRLVAAARPVLERMGTTLAQTRYFAILTNAQGMVVDAHGPIERSDRRALLITRIGTDLSEARVGTTAIGAALIEQAPIWLHRAEHFFADTGCYSCAGAPLRGPDGQLAGMLDLTGIDTPERPGLRHFAAQAARAIENAMVQTKPGGRLVRLSWPGVAPGSDGDGLLALDAEGRVLGANPAARDMLALPPAPMLTHAAELFATNWTALFDAPPGEPLELPLWSGLRVWVAGIRTGSPAAPHVLPAALPLRQLESTLIRRAVDEARGNVALAARRLGISRATVYRRLGRR